MVVCYSLQLNKRMLLLSTRHHLDLDQNDEAIIVGDGVVAIVVDDVDVDVDVVAIPADLVIAITVVAEFVDVAAIVAAIAIVIAFVRFLVFVVFAFVIVVLVLVFVAVATFVVVLKSIDLFLYLIRVRDHLPSHVQVHVRHLWNYDNFVLVIIDILLHIFVVVSF